MSDLLPESAPEEVPAVEGGQEPPAVPESPEAVVEESGQDGKVVPVERFNGLMSTFNKTQGELAAERQQRLALEARLAVLETERQTLPPENEVSDDVGELKQQVSFLTEMLLQKEADAAKDSVLSEFPEVAPFADMFVTNDPSAFRETAAAFSERLKSLQSAGTPPQPPAGEAGVVSTPPPTSPPPDLGAGPAGSASDSTANVAIQEALAKRDFSAFVRAKYEAIAN